ncbi:MAG: CYTH domain-containing protein [Pseudomonadota bacterium]|nr:CYTH domain-containing protein [Pseudomonadota bacterium]
MGVEIERKFLVVSDDWRQLGERVLLRQGYLSTDPERTVRVRIQDGEGVLTIKGKSTGATRGEWEYPIPLEEAAELLDNLCPAPLVEKYRTRVTVGRHVWEVDEFLGANRGLVVAEIELAAEDEQFLLPAWIGAEVTGQKKYYNSQLIKAPFSLWADQNS